MVLMLASVLVMVMMMMMVVMAMMMQPHTQALFCTPSCPVGKANMSFPSGQVMLMMIDVFVATITMVFAMVLVMLIIMSFTSH